MFDLINFAIAKACLKPDKYRPKIRKNWDILVEAWKRGPISMPPKDKQ